MKPILQYPNTQKPYTKFNDTSHYTYSGILSQTVDGPHDLGSIAYTPGSISDMKQRWPDTKKEVYQSILKFDLYLRGAEWILHCNHKPLEPCLSKDIKIPRLDWWSMELADCNIILVSIKDNNNILVDAISRVKC